GLGEADYKAQLKAYDDAFAAFFDRLAADGITKNNTLFVVTADEGDHYAGGAGISQPDGSLAYAHTNCSWTTTPACPANKLGDIQPEIATNWLGMVGPGVKKLGIDATTWTDHTNVRSTTLVLAGLRDDYTNDGRALIEAIETKALPQSLIAHRATLLRLGDAYEQVNAAFGQFGTDLLTASTRALKSTNESEYESIESAIADLTTERDNLAAHIKAALNAAAFDNPPSNEQQA